MLRHETRDEELSCRRELAKSILQNVVDVLWPSKEIVVWVTAAIEEAIVSVRALGTGFHSMRCPHGHVASR